MAMSMPLWDMGKMPVLLKMSLSTLLDQRLAIQRQQVTSDASGGAARTFATLLSNVPFSISPASAAVTADYARRDMIVNHRAYTTADLDTILAGGLRLGDRLTDGSVFYLVKAVKKSANAMVTSEALYEVDCEMRVA
jgi:hypothetical protein